jgi:hypothetical protein
MKPFMQFNDIVTACEEQGQAIMRSKALAGTEETLYLYYIPSTKTDNGKLVLVPQSEKEPSGYELAAGEGLKINVPYANYFEWIKQRAVYLPILAYGNN